MRHSRFHRLIPVLLAAAFALAAHAQLGAPASSAATPGVATPSSAATDVVLPWPPPTDRVAWSDGAAHRALVDVKLLGFNDFHGNLLPTSIRGTRLSGGAGGFLAYLQDAARKAPNRTLIVHAGDLLGASPPITRLLDNEPAIEFLNLLANRNCAFGAALRFHDAASWRRRPNHCNVVGTLGNHEFDAGPAEIKRLLAGGNASGGPYLQNPYRGSRVPYVSANVLERATGKTLLPPYAVVVLGGVPIGVIGAVLRDTPSIAPAASVAPLEFIDEADAINDAAAALRAQGIHAIIVTIHQGMVPTASPQGGGWRGPLRDIVARLDEDIDVVVAGHMHNFTNALFPNRGGRPVLVTQAYSEGAAFDDIDLKIDPVTRDIVSKSATVVPTWVDAGPGLRPVARGQRLAKAAELAVSQRVSRPLGSSTAVATRATTPAGESPLGNLVADAQRSVTGSDIAFMNAGGLRGDMPQGVITWGDVLTVHPFGNHLVTFDLTGAQILGLLEEQWTVGDGARIRLLKTSGISYVWDPEKPALHHVVAACDVAGRPLDAARHYTVTVTDYLAAGGDDFKTFKDLPEQGKPGPVDSEALAQYLQSLSGPIAPHSEGRIARSDLSSADLPAALCRLPRPNASAASSRAAAPLVRR